MNTSVTTNSHMQSYAVAGAFCLILRRIVLRETVLNTSGQETSTVITATSGGLYAIYDTVVVFELDKSSIDQFS